MRFLSRLLLAYCGAILVVTMWPSPPAADSSGLVADVVRGFHSIGIPMTVSRLEKVSNIVMFVPFGVLLAAVLTASRPRPSHPWWVAPAGWTALAGVAFSATIELVQKLLPGRVSSILDVLFNGSGALIGAGLMVALAAFTPVRDRLRPRASAGAASP